MEWTELPQICCPNCNRTFLEDKDVREGAELECPFCCSKLLVVVHEFVVRVACEVVGKDEKIASQGIVV
jgi:DNA-directed RNA polymerase subunit RPC12/RpoP